MSTPWLSEYRDAHVFGSGSTGLPDRGPEAGEAMRTRAFMITAAGAAVRPAAVPLPSTAAGRVRGDARIDSVGVRGTMCGVMKVMVMR